MACAPLEAWLTTDKVKGEGDINGCCCCMDLRGGIMAMSGTIAAVCILLGVFGQLYLIADKGLGVPDGVPLEFPANATYGFIEVVGIIESLAAAVVFGLAFARVRNNELKNLRLVFDLVAAFTVLYACVTFMVTPVFNVQYCEEIGSEHDAACALDTNQTQCDGEANPSSWGGKKRCAWSEAAGACQTNVALGTVTSCEVGAIVFQTVLALPLLIWQCYFLFVLNAYIYRHQANAGEDMIKSSG